MRCRSLVRSRCAIAPWSPLRSSLALVTNAIASLRLRHVDLEDSVVHLDGRDVRTKFSKSIETWFFPVGGNAEKILRDWIRYLVSELGFGPDDPLFPSTRTGFDASGLPVPPALSRECWSTATPIRTIFREAFALVGLPYFNPHSFRSTLARFGTSLYLTPEGLVSWSQNLGHADGGPRCTRCQRRATGQRRDLSLLRRKSAR